MTDIVHATLKEIVTADFRAAAIFEKYSLDFCCRGGKTIHEACSDKAVNLDSVLADLNEIRGDAPGKESLSDLSIRDLIHRIVSVHHGYVRRMMPVLRAHTQKVSAVHGANHPEVVGIAERFERVAVELEQHMAKEEQILFPYLNVLEDASEGQQRVYPPPFGTAKNPISMMEAEHQAAGDALYEIRSMSSSYTPPPDACTTYRVTYQELEEFERDLHQHVHAENNLLFPMAIALEKRIFQDAA